MELASIPASTRRRSMFLMMCMVPLAQRTTSLSTWRNCEKRIRLSSPWKRSLSSRRQHAFALRDSNKANSFESSNHQLWLDLRDNAIYPKEATDFLQQVIFGEAGDAPSIRDWIDRIVISQEMFEKVIDADTAIPTDLLYVTSDNQLIMNQKERKMSIQTGCVLECTPYTSIDPIAAMETNLKGGWVVIDSHEEDHRTSSIWLQDQISGLLSFLSATSSTAISSESGLLVPPSTKSENSALKGGIAVFCPSKGIVVQMDALLAQLDLLTTSTDSGILLPSFNSVDESVRHKHRFETALLLPFDALLWRTVLEMRLTDDDNDDQ